MKKSFDKETMVAPTWVEERGKQERGPSPEPGLGQGSSVKSFAETRKVGQSNTKIVIRRILVRFETQGKLRSHKMVVNPEGKESGRETVQTKWKTWLVETPSDSGRETRPPFLQLSGPL